MLRVDTLFMTLFLRKLRLAGLESAWSIKEPNSYFFNESKPLFFKYRYVCNTFRTRCQTENSPQDPSLDLAHFFVSTWNLIFLRCSSEQKATCYQLIKKQKYFTKGIFWVLCILSHSFLTMQVNDALHDARLKYNLHCVL